jgi:chromosome segregation ATPase
MSRMIWEKNVLSNKISMMRKQIEDKESGRLKLLDEYNQEKKLLLKTSKEMENPRDVRSVESEMNTTLAWIETSETMGDLQGVEKVVAILNKEREFKESLIDLYKKKTNNILECVKMMIEKRERIKEEVSRMAKQEFMELTGIRGYEGDLIFDHENMRLDLSLKVQSSKSVGSKSTLSGGERSYAGICFLLSLWPSIGCPVKILDEFDVYMDNLNRKCTIKIILDFFRRHSVQVILITPLNTQDLLSEICDIIVLDPPRPD